MKITVCIGSSCHLKGSRQVIEQLQALIDAHQLTQEVKIGGTFCMGKCRLGVCVTLEGEDTVYSVHPEEVTDFFNSKVLVKYQ